MRSRPWVDVVIDRYRKFLYRTSSNSAECAVLDPHFRIRHGFAPRKSDCFLKKVMDFRFIPMCDFRFIPTLVDNIIFYLYNFKQDCYC